jgi:hypothetical protein
MPPPREGPGGWSDRPPVPRLASVIVTGLDRIEHARRCLTALSRHTRMPWELIVVGGEADDGMADYLLLACRSGSCG